MEKNRILDRKLEIYNKLGKYNSYSILLMKRMKNYF